VLPDDDDVEANRRGARPSRGVRVRNDMDRITFFVIFSDGFDTFGPFESKMSGWGSGCRL